MSNDMSIADKVYSYTAAKIAYLKSLEETGAGKGMLAELRRGIGKSPGELPELWGMIFDRMPEELLGKCRNEISSTEWAVYTVLTLYALHKQGADYEVNKQGASIGAAAAGLVESEDDMPRVTNRFQLVVTANSPFDLAYHMRGLIQLFKSNSIPLDYAALAKDLYLFNISDAANSVKLRWGRDFYRVINKRFGGKENGQ